MTLEEQRHVNAPLISQRNVVRIKNVVLPVMEKIVVRNLRKHVEQVRVQYVATFVMQIRAQVAVLRHVNVATDVVNIRKVMNRERFVFIRNGITVAM
jgi:hypothetical protein